MLIQMRAAFNCARDDKSLVSGQGARKRMGDDNGRNGGPSIIVNNSFLPLPPPPLVHPSPFSFRLSRKLSPFPTDLKNSREEIPGSSARKRYLKGRGIRLYRQFSSIRVLLSSIHPSSTLSLSGFFKDRDIPSLGINMHRLVNIERIPRQTRESKGIRRAPL